MTAPAENKPLKKITNEELKLHNKVKPDGKADLWVLINGKVYDMSEFYTKHPGGPDIIEELAGKDGSQSFNDAAHPAASKRELETYCVGEYVTPKQFKKLEEIAEHNQPGDLWLLINNKVYDVSKFKHPGGIEILV